MAARNAAARFTPIAVTAVVIVAAGTGALVVAASPVFRAFGPGLALAVLIAMVVAVSLTPALLAVLGRVALWPHDPQETLARQPGVAGVLGPEDQLQPTRQGLFLARDGTAARYLLILSDNPLQAPAIGTLSRLRANLPRLLQEAGLPGARPSIGGDTAVAEDVVDRTIHDLGRIAGVGPKGGRCRDILNAMSSWLCLSPPRVVPIPSDASDAESGTSAAHVQVRS